MSASDENKVTTYKDKMIYRRVGNSGLFVSAVSMGTWINFGIEVSGKDAKELVSAALSHGINFFDTAETYQDGESEICLGQVLRELNVPRSDIVVATKIFWGGYDRKNLKANDQGCSRKHIIEGLAACLKRLQLDYVDIVYCHRPDVHTPIEETVRAMDWVINKGQAFYWGTSEWSAEDIQIAQHTAERLGLIGPIVEQCQYSLLHRKRFEVEYKRLFEEKKLGSTIWSPLAGGVLTGKYNGTTRDNLPKDSRFTIERMQWLANLYFAGVPTQQPWESVLARVEKLGDVAKDLGCTQGQLALAWCLRNKNVSTAIVGARNPAQLEETLGALDVIEKITPEVIVRIEAIMENNPAAPEDFTKRGTRGLPGSKK